MGSSHFSVKRFLAIPHHREQDRAVRPASRRHEKQERRAEEDEQADYPKRVSHAPQSDRAGRYERGMNLPKRPPSQTLPRCGSSGRRPDPSGFIITRPTKFSCSLYSV